jgi:hypothetical protein
LPQDLIDSLHAAVDDLMTTTVRHLERQPARTLRSDPIQLRLLGRSSIMRVEVHHPGAGGALRDPCPGPEGTPARGRRSGTDASGGTTCVWFEFDLPAEAQS